ncbi:MAG TPA: ATP-binding protein [Blastocatellia bacterium]|nr:ATP-binding protein [Blastocatellia bacterium]
MKDVAAYSNSPSNPLETIYQLIAAIGRAKQIEEIYEEALNGLQDTAAADRAAILLLEGDGVMRFKAWRGLSEQYRGAVEGHTPWTLEDTDPQPVLIANVEHAPMADGLRGALKREGIRAVAFIPLVSRGRLLGKFMVYYNAPHSYAASEVQLAQIIAGHVAFAIEQRRATQVLKASEECFSTAFKANPDPMAIHAIRDGRFVEVNDSFLRISGYARDEVVGHTIADLGFLADPSYFDRAARLLAEQGRLKEFEFEYCTRAGERRWGLMSAEIIQIGGEPYILSTTSDISARKQIEETTRLHRSVEEQLSLLIDASGVLLTSLDPEAVLKAVLDLSRRLVPADAYAVWRYRESAGRWEIGCAEGLSETYRQVTIDTLGAIPPSLVPTITSQDVEQDPLLAGRTDLYRAEGIRSLFAVPLHLYGENSGTIAFYFKDPHRFTQAEMRIATALANLASAAMTTAESFQEQRRLRVQAEESNRLKDEFLATVSHELRTPLTPLLGWTHMLRSQRVDAAMLASGLEVIERNVHAQTQIINDILDVSRIMTGKLRLDVRAVRLAPIIEAAIETVRHAATAKKIRLRTQLAQPDDDVHCDPDRLQQIVWNLLSNAIKFTPDGGEVSVALSRQTGGAEITVSDTGQGISADFLPHVFDRFRQADSSYTRKHGGLGLGLAIVRHLVELHGGTVEARSAGQNQGATFTVRLPLADPAGLLAPPVAATAEPEPRLSLAGARLLLVDDDEDTLAVLSLALRQSGAEVESAGSAALAFAAIRQSPPDVLICDIGMPEEDGYAFIERVRRLGGDQGGDVKAIALTAYAREEDRRRALASGFQHHLPKPIDPDELTALLASVIAE